MFGWPTSDHLDGGKLSSWPQGSLALSFQVMAPEIGLDPVHLRGLCSMVLQ